MCKCVNAERFGTPIINVGDLVHEEIKAGTALGLEAKAAMDATKTVPEHVYISVLQARSTWWLLRGACRLFVAPADNVTQTMHVHACLTRLASDRTARVIRPLYRE